MDCRERAAAASVSATAEQTELKHLLSLSVSNVFKKRLKTVLFDRAYWLIIVVVVRRSWTVRRAAPYKSLIVGLFVFCICTITAEYSSFAKRSVDVKVALFNPLNCRGNYSATWNNVKLVHWPLMGGLLHLVQRWGDWEGPQPAQAPPRCTKCNSPPINGQCTNHRITVWRSVALRL